METRFYCAVDPGSVRGSKAALLRSARTPPRVRAAKQRRIKLNRYKAGAVEYNTKLKMYSYESIRMFMAIALRNGCQSLQPLVSEVTRQPQCNISTEEKRALRKIMGTLKREGLVDQSRQKEPVVWKDIVAVWQKKNHTNDRQDGVGDRISRRAKKKRDQENHRRQYAKKQ